MNKKSQGLSVNTIIIAAIALIVLVVLIAIFTGRFGSFSENIQDCPSQGGDCTLSEAGCQTAVANGERMGLLRGTNCPTNTVCCIKTK